MDPLLCPVQFQDQLGTSSGERQEQDNVHKVKVNDQGLSGACDDRCVRSDIPQPDPSEVRTGQERKDSEPTRGAFRQAEAADLHDAPDKTEQTRLGIMFNTISTHEYTLSMDVVH